jgi:hypothetical protein
MYRRELKKLHDTKSDLTARIVYESKCQFFSTMLFVNAVMIPRPTLSTVPVASSYLGSIPNLEDDNASTNVSINDNDNDEVSEGVSDEH